MSITSGLSPIRRYANGGDVNTERQNMLAKLGFPSGITNEQLDAAIAKQKGAAYLPESQASGTTIGDLPGLFKENIFDYTDPVDYATLPFLSLKAAKLAGKAGKKVYDTVRGSGGKVKENLRGIGAYVGADMLADEIRGDDAFFNKTEEEGLEDDALDEATKDVADVNAEEEKKEKEKTLAERLSGLSDISTFESMMTPGQMTGGSFIKASGISTPEIRRYQNGGITNMMPVSMAEGGSIDFAKLGSDLGGMPDTPTMSTGSAIAPATINTPEIKQGNPEALKDAEEDFDKFKADVKSNYVNFASGGIANIDPIMMANGGIAKFVFGGAAIKKTAKGIRKLAKDKLDKRAKNKAAKAKAKAKAKADKDKAAKAKAKADAKETGVTKDKPEGPGFLDLVNPTYASGITATAKKASDLVSAAGRNIKPIAGAAAAYGLPLGIAGGIGYAALKGDKTTKTPTKSTDATVPEIEESNAMKDILYQNSLERATSAGRTEPVFMDYLASFPGSYTEKVGKDPEFARQMMAGFMAMMKPTEGYVPRNSLVDFGEAAMAEEVRQEGEIPDQIKMFKEFERNPQLLEAYKKFTKSQEAYDPIQEQKARAQIFSNLQEMIFGPGFDEDDIPTNIATKQPAEPFNVYNEFLSLGGDQAALFALKDKYSME